MGSKQISTLRLRIGVLLILIFWLPLWVFAPHIANDNDWNTQTVTLAIMTFQVIIGVAGVAFAGKAIYTIVKDTPRRQVLKVIFKVIKNGNYTTEKNRSS